MTHTDYTKLILNIKDNNIFFNEDCLKIVNIKGVETKVFHGYLTYIPEFCPKFGCINECSNDIIKWNWKRNCKINITKACGYNALLVLDKQIKHTACGYKKFNHLKARVMLIKGLLNPINT